MHVMHEAQPNTHVRWLHPAVRLLALDAEECILLFHSVSGVCQ